MRNQEANAPNNFLNMASRNCISLQLLALFGLLAFTSVNGAIKQFNWVISYASVTRLCHTKTLVSLNGQFQGPTAIVNEGDTVVVNVTNMVANNVTIHWHGVRQIRSAWADGPAYITQCPIQTGHSYVHQFQVTDQRGTLLWHAHASWLRATLYGAFIIKPSGILSSLVPYPFPTPQDEFPIVLGEWWNTDVEQIISDALASGAGYKISDAITINGQPGDFYDCSANSTPVFNVRQGKTYLLRIVNAAVNFQLYFGVRDHNLTVVEIDATYTKPYLTNWIVLAPGQTTNVLLTATQPIGQYYMAASVYSPAPSFTVPFPTIPATAIINYVGSDSSNSSEPTTGNGTIVGLVPDFPAYDDAKTVQDFSNSLRNLPYVTDPGPPLTVDENLFFTVGYALKPCPSGSTCTGPQGQKLAAAVNNISFVDSRISLLQAYYSQLNGSYTTDFPNTPLIQFDYTGKYSGGFQTILGTRVKVLNYNANVQIVFQDTSVLFNESHPIHLHGFNFYIMGSGFGNYDSVNSPRTFNLVDPPSRNTVAVPPGGWSVVRFRADNPGVWYMHCHIDLHVTWGMSMAFIVRDGNGTSQTLPPPPTNLPPC